MLKYLWLSHSGFLNGAERVLIEAVDVLIKNEDCEIFVILPIGNGDSLREELLKRNVIVHNLDLRFTHWVDLKFSKKRFFLNNFILFFKFIRLLWIIKPHIFILNTIVHSPMPAFCSRILGIKVIWFIHEFGDLDGYKFLFGKKNTHRIINLVSHVLLFPSNYLMNAFSESHKTPRIAVKLAVSSINIVNKIPFTHYQKTGIWKIVLLGRTSEGKGQMELIEALKILKVKYQIDNFKALIIGINTSDYGRRLALEIEKLKLKETVQLIPFQNNVHTFLADADIGVITSSVESFGRVTVEYLKAGLVVVGANAGGTCEILSDFEQESFLYNSGDVDDLAYKLFQLFVRPILELQHNVNSQVSKVKKLYNDELFYLHLNNAVQQALDSENK